MLNFTYWCSDCQSLTPYSKHLQWRPEWGSLQISAPWWRQRWPRRWPHTEWPRSYPTYIILTVTARVRVPTDISSLMTAALASTLASTLAPHRVAEISFLHIILTVTARVRVPTDISSLMTAALASTLAPHRVAEISVMVLLGAKAGRWITWSSLLASQRIPASSAEDFFSKSFYNTNISLSPLLTSIKYYQTDRKLTRMWIYL